VEGWRTRARLPATSSVRRRPVVRRRTQEHEKDTVASRHTQTPRDLIDL
jgi:hypothetical protein